MNRLSKLLTATAAGAALSLAAAASQAAIFISIDGVNALSGITYDPNNPANFSLSLNCTNPANCGGFESVSIGGNAPERPGLLHSATLEVNKKNTGAAALTVWVTRTGFVPLGKKQYQTFGVSNVGGPISNTLVQYVSNTNQLFGGTQIGTFSASANGSSDKNLTTFFDFSAPGTYSVTQKFIISAANGSERSARPAIGAEVPEPATWALMIGGFGAAGAMLRRRKAVAA